MSTFAIRSAPDWCARYRTENGFDATVDEHGQILLRTGSVDGVSLPAGLAERALHELMRRDLQTPVIANTRSDFWMFLTQGARRADRSVPRFGALYRHRVLMTAAGALITLPGPEDGIRYWEVPPHGTRRPPFDSVVDITLRIAHSLPESA
ncbi:hypothetical protein [Nocardia brasiliensis]|uniref:hypothetical protein n=1 Tax=Nocardia brasiliensis TaxID=37326 RepID=UPI002457E432|nr:hypothetical protein [Nocardia brasiliensis]